MIDIENYVFDQIKTEVTTTFTNARMYGEYVALPESFPCVTLVEADNSVYRGSLDQREEYALVMYEINIFTNTSTKKTDAKKIAHIIDEKMSAMGFTRIYRDQVPNVDRTIYRIVLRYNGVVSQNDDSYTVYKA